MADAHQTASFQVLGASVQRTDAGRRLLVRAVGFPAAGLFFSEDLARAVGEALIAKPASIERALAEKAEASRGRYLKISDELEAKYCEIYVIADSKPKRGKIAQACRERGVDIPHFWGWRSARKAREAKA
jgi:hypothetical protein